MKSTRNIVFRVLPALILLVGITMGCTGPSSPSSGVADQVIAPTLSPNPAEGDITVFTEIIIVTATPGAAIHYTIDSTDPTDLDSIYIAPFTLPIGTITVKGFAVLSGMTNSAVSTAVYTVNDQAAPVVFSESAGPIADNVEIVLSTPTAGADIYYTVTTDGTEPFDPTDLDTPYTAAITMAGLGADTLNIKAFAVFAGFGDSEICQVDYTKATAAIPVSDRVDGSMIPDNMAVTLTSDTAAASIYYTTDGTDPSAASTSYDVTGPFLLPVGSATVKSIAINVGYFDSPLSTVTLSVEAQAEVPSISAASGFAASGTAVTLSTTSGLETIYYTLDGSDPVTDGNIYSVPVTLTSSSTLRTYAGGTGYYPSVEASAEYHVYRSIDSLTADSGALMAVATDGSVVIVRSGSSYYDLTAGSLIARSVVAEPAGTVLDFSIDASGHLHALYQVGTDLVYWTSDGGTIDTVNTTAVSLADARILIDSVGNARIVFAQYFSIDQDDVVEVVYTSTGVFSRRSLYTLNDRANGVDAALDSTDLLYIAAANIKNASSETIILSYNTDTLDWNPPVLNWTNNANNPALIVKGDDSLLMSYVRPDKPWFFISDVNADGTLTALLTIKTFTTDAAGDTNMAYDAVGNLYISSHGFGWLYDGISETAFSMAAAPYRLATDPLGSGSASMYILGTAGLTLYTMQ